MLGLPPEVLTPSVYPWGNCPPLISTSKPKSETPEDSPWEGSHRVGNDRVWSDRVSSDRVRSDRVGSGRVRSCRVGSDRVRRGRVGSGRVRNGCVGSVE